MSVLEKYMLAKIIPVAVVDNEKELRNLADLCSKYVPSIELTMRTSYARTALEILHKEYSHLSCAAATILSVEQAEEAIATGTKIIISPGFTPKLVEHCAAKGYQYVPGVASAAELEFCLSHGFKILKFFPAEAAGGIKWLKAVGPVYKHMGVTFMPLGGVNMDNVTEYLKLSNVIACGGSWLCPKDLMEKGNWEEIEKRFKEVQDLLKGLS